MGHLQELSLLLDKNRCKTDSYSIPMLWDSFGYAENRIPHTKQIMHVDPYDFYSQCIDYICGHQSPDIRNKRKSMDICANVIYSMLPRTQTAWKHYEKDGIISGSFLKALAVLPQLKRIGVSILYLLPIFETSDKYKKGGLGSPYATKDFYKIDPSLHDDLLGEYCEHKLNIEFAAFTEACHKLGILVMLDFSFRTCARDNELIRDHPDWFYWIENDLEDFKSPKIKDLPNMYQLTVDNAQNIFMQFSTIEYLKHFRDNPRHIDEDIWKKIKDEADILDAIEKNYNITTAPAYSDVINDFQPPWTDVSYLRYELGMNKIAEEFIPDVFPPYLLFDTIKCNVIPPVKPNKKLYKYISDVIPHYQKLFNIDGARIDMGHAMPKALIDMILDKAKRVDDKFLFWSEVMNAEKSAEAKENGFDFITGAIWYSYSQLNQKEYNSLMFDELLACSLPMVAALETADTPRITSYFSDKKSIESVCVYNALLPNTLVYINSGLELNEVQPMNLGLGKSKKGRYALPEYDPLYGKLAFFDEYMFHWTDIDSSMLDHLAFCNAIRMRFSHLIKLEYFNIFEPAKSNSITSFSYKNSDEELYVLLNRGKKRSIETADFNPDIFLDKQDVEIIYWSHPKKGVSLFDEIIHLHPHESFILYHCGK